MKSWTWTGLISQAQNGSFVTSSQCSLFVGKKKHVDPWWEGAEQKGMQLDHHT